MDCEESGLTGFIGTAKSGTFRLVGFVTLILSKRMSKCFRCSKKGFQTWNICADGNRDRWVCKKCDIELNEIVLIFMGFRNWRAKMKRYRNLL